MFGETFFEFCEESGYDKSILFIRKDNYCLVRAVHWVHQGQELKYLDVTLLEQVDGIWVNKAMSMTTKKGKRTLHKTLIELGDVKFGEPLDKGLFTVQRMQKGY